MAITYDPEKRRLTMLNRQLDFEDAAEIFKGIHYTSYDRRREYGEDRLISVGLLNGEEVVVVWTERDQGKRVISMRKASKDERRNFREWLDRSR